MSDVAAARTSAQRDDLRRSRLDRPAPGLGRQGHPFDDLEAVAGQADQPQRVVREPADLAYADVAQDLRPDAEVAEDAGAGRGESGARRSRARPLGHVEHVEAATRAPQIEDDPSALVGDTLHGAMQER